MGQDREYQMPMGYMSGIYPARTLEIRPEVAALSLPNDEHPDVNEFPNTVAKATCYDPELQMVAMTRPASAEYTIIRVESAE